MTYRHVYMLLRGAIKGVFLGRSIAIARDIMDGFLTRLQLKSGRYISTINVKRDPWEWERVDITELIHSGYLEIHVLNPEIFIAKWGESFSYWVTITQRGLDALRKELRSREYEEEELIDALSEDKIYGLFKEMYENNKKEIDRLKSKEVIKI